MPRKLDGLAGWMGSYSAIFHPITDIEVGNNNTVNIISDHDPFYQQCISFCSGKKSDQDLTVQAMTTNNVGHFPLHIFCSSYILELKPTVGMTILLKLISLYPRAALQKDADGNLPLHIAIMRKFPSVDLVTTLLQAYPKAAEVKNRDGSLPLFLACRHANVNPKIIQALLSAYPDAALKISFGCFALHQLMYHGCNSTEAVKMLIVANPKAISSCNSHGNMPIHLACGANPSIDTIKLLVETFPASITHRNKAGETPLDKSIAHANGNPEVNPEVIRFLLLNYPVDALANERKLILGELNWTNRKSAMLISILRPETHQNKILPFLYSACYGVWREVISYL